MSTPIIRLFGVIVVLFALLIGWTSRWTVFDAKSLQNNALNVRTLIDELKIKRGRILADDNSVLARSVPAAGGTWTRTYPTGSLFSQPVGYSNLAHGSAAGLELSRGPELRGLQTGVSSIFGQLSSHPVGDDVYTTLDPKAQRLALQQLGGQAGSVVALDPQTGAVKVMVALPGYDDNHPDATGPNISTFNRSTQAGYPPGSTFKIVTATAAIDSGQYTPNSTVNGKSPITVSGVPLSNDNNQSLRHDRPDHRAHVLGEHGVGPGRRARGAGHDDEVHEAVRLLLQAPARLSTRRAQHQPPVLQRHRPPLSTGQPQRGHRQDRHRPRRIQVTPLQMAMVAAAVANGGKLMVPHLTDRAVDQDGKTVETIKPSVYNQVMKPTTAQEIAQMMKRVVDEGTGTPAQLGGIDVAGKTGTAQIGVVGSNLTEPWFIGFAPIQNPKVAIAVTIERSQGGFGGTVAAPIAKAVIQTLLAEGQ